MTRTRSKKELKAIHSKGNAKSSQSRYHRKEQHYIYADVPKAGEIKPFTTKVDRDRLVKERFEELDLKEKGWKEDKQWRLGWSGKDGTQVHVFPATLHGEDAGKYQVDIWQTHPYKKVLMRTRPSEKQAKNYAIKWMKEHPSG